MNFKIELENVPKRIVSLVPSQTELLYHLGLNEEVVGITKFCVHPAHWHKSKKRVGGTKKIDIDVVKALSPDIIIANKEENLKEDIEQLKLIAPVWISDVDNVEEALLMIESIGEITSTEEKARNLIHTIKEGITSINKLVSEKTFLYFIWKDPNYVAGKQTYIDDVLSLVGLKNLCKDVRYPEWKNQEIQPDIVFLSSEPYPFNTSNISEFQNLFPSSKIMLIDGEMCSWYGSRMLETIAYLNNILALIEAQ